MTYTNVAKPTGAPYTTPNPQGRQTYDQAELIYNDADTFYDGVNTTAYVSVAKPTGSVYTLIAKPT